MFQGQRYDPESGLYYFKNRYYDPETGRFITRDPARDGINLYAFVNNNPINFIDPTGQYVEFSDDTHAIYIFCYIFYHHQLCDTLSEIFSTPDWPAVFWLNGDKLTGSGWSPEYNEKPWQLEDTLLQDKINISIEDFLTKVLEECASRLDEAKKDVERFQHSLLTEKALDRIRKRQEDAQYRLIRTVVKNATGVAPPRDGGLEYDDGIVKDPQREFVDAVKEYEESKQALDQLAEADAVREKIHDEAKEEVSKIERQRNNLKAVIEMCRLLRETLGKSKESQRCDNYTRESLEF